MKAASELSRDVGRKPACEALRVPRATFYRYLGQSHQFRSGKGSCTTPPLSLSQTERQDVIDTLHSEKFQDKAPYEVYATLLDEGKYHCSIRTMYRILKSKHGDIKERRRGHQRTQYKKPELLATAPNQVWSWDITKLKGPAKWTYFYLYVILDIFSRYVVGWMVAHREQQALAKHLIEQSCIKQGILPGQLTIHADRGASMKSKAVAQLLADLGVTKTHSRPHVSNDNPYSESLFRTFKYRPEYPVKGFDSIEVARQWVGRFVKWYNDKHLHSAIRYVTPSQRHKGEDIEILANRKRVYQRAKQRRHERWSRSTRNWEPITEVWLNCPKDAESSLPAFSKAA